MTKQVTRTTVVLLLCFGIFHQSLLAQAHNPLINNSGEIISKSLQLQIDTDYIEAIKQLRTIPANDTNYYEAMGELVNSYYGHRDYDSVINISRRFLAEENAYHATFYNSLGNALDASDKPEEAVKVFMEGIGQFPNVNLLYYNLGIAYRNLKKYPEAVNSFQKSIEINPFHAGSHLMLGLMYLQAQQMVPAMFGLSTFLLVSPESGRANDVIGLLEKIAQIEYKSDSDVFTLPLNPDEDDFSEQETILRSKIALNKGYKSQSKLHYDIVKQLQVLCEKLEPSADAKGFCMRTYVPLYSDLFKKGYFETFSYYFLAAANQPDIQAWNKKNDKKLKQFAHFVIYKMRDISAQYPIMVNGKPYNLPHGIENGKVVSIGKTNADGTEDVGYWYFFHENNYLWKEGGFDNSGKEDGEWKFYYDDGTLKETHVFKSGEVQGPLKTYYRSGALESELNYSNHQVTGTVKTYHPSGQPNRQLEISNGMRNGKFTVYNQNGDKQEEGTYKNDKLDGSYKTYFRNGNIDVESNYTDGKLTGAYVSYFSNGKKYLEAKYVNDQPVGTVKYYYRSGKVREERTFDNNGKPTGSDKKYYEDGTLLSETKFDNSGTEESYTENDDDGKLWLKIISKGGKVSEVIYYDKKGGVIIKNERTRGTCNVTAYYPDAQLYFKGQLKNDQQVGEWKTYYSNGALKEIEHYNDEGDHEGSYKSYFRNGTLEYEYSYKKGKEDGYFKSYFQNGKIHTEGWYENGDRSGTWLSYNPLGILTAKEYYIAGTQHGRQEYYNDVGKLYSVEVKEDEILQEVINFDTTGKVINTVKLKNGSGPVNTVFFNGKKRSEITLKNGWLQGPAKFYHINGKTATEGSYKNDWQEGEWKWYDNFGNVESVTTFHEDSKQGKTFKYENGKLYSVDHFKDDNSDSVTTWFFPSGKVEQQVTFKDDVRNGPVKIYNEDGSLYVLLNYKDDNLLSYTYNGPDGNLLPPIDIAKETATITTYFPGKKKAFEGQYKSGWREGKFVRYSPTGAVVEERNYKNNFQDGPQKQYNAAGKLIAEENYVYADKHGTCKYYYDDGKIKRIENYFLDDPHGEWKYYDKNGKVTKTEHYYMGELLD
ncbi:MAG TPA: tetratricopeptide repeat protein [Chitinophagales bacterium]|nr:tetratricopeptide repeat protein [Chitinophagales bacterium]